MALLSKNYVNALVDYELFFAVDGAGKKLSMILWLSFVCHSRICIFCIIHFVGKTIVYSSQETDSTALEMSPKR